MVDYGECLRHGGAPGLRRQYDSNDCGSFVCDPDGNKIEALTFAAKYTSAELMEPIFVVIIT